MKNSNEGFNYGPKISQTEYESRSSELAKLEFSEGITKEQEENLRQEQINLLIDYRLGVGFPEHRRLRILAAHKKLSRRLLWRLLGSFVVNPIRPSDALARSQVRNFSKLLNDAELAALFDLTIEDVVRLKK